MLSEGGIRVPFIVSWPNELPKGIVYDKAVSSLDVAATSIALAGLKPVKEFDGVNIIPYLKGEIKEDPHEALYWRFWDQSAIRMGDWKFLKSGKREFLFNVETDDHEKTNLILQHPNKAKRMKKKLKKWAKNLSNPGISENETAVEKLGYDFYFNNK
jgi:arylsulfatase A-like enzyme